MDFDDDEREPWLAPWFQHPARTELSSGHHLRPLRAADVGLPGLPDGLDLSGEALAYGVFDDEERSVLGVVTLSPGSGADAAYDVVVRWDVPDCASVAAVLADFLPEWLERAWPFARRLVVRG